MQDTVLDSDWTMVANKITTQRAAPQRDFDEQYDLPELITWDTPTPTHNGAVESGRVWLTNQPITLVAFQVWVPELNNDTNYVFRWYSYPEGQPELLEFKEVSEPLLLENQWTTLAVTQTLLRAGMNFGITVNALNSGSTTAPGGTPADWNRQADSNNTDPTTGGWNRSNNGTTLRIHENTADAALINFVGSIAGTSFQIVDTTDANRSVTYTATTGETYAGNVYSWSVVQDSVGSGGEPAVGARCIITVTVPVPSPTKFVKLTGGNPTVSWGTARGVLQFDGVDQPTPDADAFGVRVLVDT